MASESGRWLVWRPIVGAAAVILGIFLSFAGDGIHGFFAPDEMMNLYAAWSPSVIQLMQNDRPVGAFIYRALFGLFGLNPLPYRLVCFALLLANLALLYAFCARLSASREVAVLACLAGAYHAHLADLYYTSSAIFDLLCFFFSYLALVYYLGIRRRSAYPDFRQTVVILVLYVFALGSKEMAVLFPVFMALLEVLYYPETFSRVRLYTRLTRGAWFWWTSIPLTLLYLAYKIGGAHRMTANPDYQLHFSPDAFLTAEKHYLSHLFYSMNFNEFKVVALLSLLLVFALIVRRRELLFAWCVIMIGPLPFLFITPRGFFVMYMTLPGWYLYAGCTLVLFCDAATRRLARLAPGVAVRHGQLVLFAALAVFLIPLHWREKPLGAAVVTGDYQAGRTLIGQLAARYPNLPHASKILFLDDPYPADDYILYFTFALQYRDRDLRVDRVKMRPELAPGPARAQYSHVFVLSASGLDEVPPSQ